MNTHGLVARARLEARRVRGRLRRQPVDVDPQPVAVPREVTDAGSRRPLTLPSGVDRDQLHAMLSSLSIDGAPEDELSAYIGADFERFVHTWGLVADATGRALELGANPYFTTLMLREFTDLDVTLTNFFGVSSGDELPRQHLKYRHPDGHDVEVDLPYHAVNVEQDRFPFDDGTFDVTLFCEVVEHLVNDPVNALLEIRRVLKPGGRLVLSTPNVARLENVARLIAGANIYDPYSGHGAYGRHNREFTRHELHQLLDFCGFGDIHSFTADVHPNAAAQFCSEGNLATVVEGRLPDLGQYIFVSATRREGEVPHGRPSFLYRSLPAEQLVPVP